MEICGGHEMFGLKEKDFATSSNVSSHLIETKIEAASTSENVRQFLSDSHNHSSRRQHLKSRTGFNLLHDKSL